MSKRALITGADGFIGSHLTEMLVAEGYQVKALTQYNSFNDWGWLEDVACKDGIEVLSGDVRDPHYCKHITKNTDIVFHLTALIAIPYSYVAPDIYVDTNIKGTLNICQAARDNDVERCRYVRYFTMKTAEFIRRARRYSRQADLEFQYDPRRGKGSHGQIS